MYLKSDAFCDKTQIPIQYTADTSEFSPPLQWFEQPEAVESFALICEDENTKKVYWIIYNIPGPAFMLAPKIPHMQQHPSGMCQGPNSFDKTGYSGPQAHEEKHPYIFTLYALNKKQSKPGQNKEQLLKSMQGHILARASLTGLY